MPHDIKIYTTNSCPYCIKAKAFFNRNGLKYEEIDLTDNFTEINRLKEETGHKTVPLIFINNSFIGGYTDLIEKIDTRQLILNNWRAKT